MNQKTKSQRQDASPRQPREGYQPLFRSSPFLDVMGPIYYRGWGETLSLGAYISGPALNGRGVAHAGFLAGFADIALGYALSTSTDPPGRYLTAHLSIDFADIGNEGDWLESNVDIQRIGKRLAFVSVSLSVDGRRIVCTSGVFARIDESPPEVEPT